MARLSRANQASPRDGLVISSAPARRHPATAIRMTDLDVLERGDLGASR